MNEPRVLVLDIETSPLLAYVWGREDQHIGLNQIKSDWYIMAWAAKWLNNSANRIEYQDCRKTLNDKEILKDLWHLLDEADIVITQNGKNFDAPKINARFMLNGMKPPSPYEHLDTYKLVKKVAAFTSNSLDYLTNNFCEKYKKLSHDKFPGMKLWTECLDGNNAAWEEMKKYNIHDVLATEELYNKIKAWTPRTMPEVYTSEDRKCGRCGKYCLEFRGQERTKLTVYRRTHCTSCGSWGRGGKAAAA